MFFATLAATLATGPPAVAVTVAWDTLIPFADGGYLSGMTTLGDGTFLLLRGQDPTDGTDLCRLARLDPDGSVDWIRLVGRGDALECDAISAGTDSLYVAMTARGSLDGMDHAQEADAYIRKLTPTGDVVWTRSFATADSESAWDVAAGGGGAYLAGWVISSDEPRTFDAWLRRYDADGDALWTRFLRTDDWGLFSAVSADATGAYVGWTDVSAGSGGAVRKYDPNGSLVWETPLPTGGRTDISDLALDTGTLYAGGSTEGAFPGLTSGGGGDAWTASLDTATGGMRWARQFGSNELDFVNAITVGPMGVYAVGATEGALPRFENHGQRDAFVRAFGGNGSRRWTRQFGTRRDDDAVAAAANATGVLVGGTTTGNLGAAHVGRGLFAFARQWQPP
jgi:hypothetical protein